MSNEYVGPPILWGLKRQDQFLSCNPWNNTSISNIWTSSFVYCLSLLISNDSLWHLPLLVILSLLKSASKMSEDDVPFARFCFFLASPVRVWECFVQHSIKSKIPMCWVWDGGVITQLNFPFFWLKKNTSTHQIITPRELTYPPKMAFWRWFSFSQGGIC